jgi:hypothetical protein
LNPLRGKLVSKIDASKFNLHRYKEVEEEPPRRAAGPDATTSAASDAANTGGGILGGIGVGGHVVAARPRIQISISDGGDWVEGDDGGGGEGGGTGGSSRGGAEPSLLGEGDFYAGGGPFAAAEAAAERAARSRAAVTAAAAAALDASKPGPGMWHSRSMSKRRGEMDAAADEAVAANGGG